VPARRGGPGAARGKLTAPSAPFGKQRLRVSASRPQLDGDASDGERPARSQGIEALVELRVEVAGIVDPRRHPDELAGGAQLVEDRQRNAEARRDALDARRSRAGGAEAVDQLRDAGAHHWLQLCPHVGKGDPPAMTDDRSGSDQAIEDGQQAGVVEREHPRSTVSERATITTLGARPAQEGVDPQVRRQRFAPVESPEGAEQPSLGESPLGRLKRIRGHRPSQPAAGADPVPSIAILIASASSVDRVWVDAPFSTGFAKSLVFVLPWRLLMTTPS
jgi:hypothetical protein